MTSYLTNTTPETQPLSIPVPLRDYDIDSVQQAKKIIDADISRHFTIEDIARQVAIGKTKLKHGFRLFYGKGLYTYLREVRMEKAMELVTETHKTFKAIAKACGFKHYNNFIAAFTKFHGTTPGNARKTKHIIKPLA